jgi:hypothetical protein
MFIPNAFTRKAVAKIVFLFETKKLRLNTFEYDDKMLVGWVLQH